MSLLTRAFKGSVFRRPMATRGFEEFFTNQQPGRTGRYWRLEQLRLKSFEDLRKLWFVLLKERNMLYTYRFASARAGVFMKNHERIWKVRVSMRNIKKIVNEREVEHKMLTDPSFVARREAKHKMLAGRRLSKLLRRRKPLGKFRTRDNQPIAALYKLKPRDPATTPYDPTAGMRHAIYDKLGRVILPPGVTAKGARHRAKALERDLEIVLTHGKTATSTASSSGSAASTA